jgi:hypothetical protein
MLLSEIQLQLKAPKGQFNSFGKYNYRSCEDILEAVKPLLGDSVLLITDDIVLIGDRYYVKATARLISKECVTEVSAFAREQFDKKGMDDAQITGAASSYARKYALNGLFLIDDTKDADTAEPEQKKAKKEDPPKTTEPPKEKTPDIISNDQRIRLRTIATTAKYTNEVLKKIIAACGYESSKDVLVKDYQVICDFIEGTPIEQVDAGLHALTQWCKEDHSAV